MSWNIGTFAIIVAVALIVILVECTMWVIWISARKYKRKGKTIVLAGILFMIIATIVFTVYLWPYN